MGRLRVNISWTLTATNRKRKMRLQNVASFLKKKKKEKPREVFVGLSVISI